jgi:hypothetical protein
MRKLILVNILFASLLILIFDVAMFVFLPANYVWRFPEYRFISPPDVGGRGRYPNSYFVKHQKRGFDIGRNKRGRHWVDGVTYSIWSNSLGCFDNDHLEYNRYVYFAGDSFTWGYTPFDAKFGTLIEQSTGTQILKCGVTHTGQRHQFGKLIEIVKEIGKPPRAIFVFYSSNDVANDYAHPHTTVIQGWQVNNVSLNSNNELVRHSHEELTRRIQDNLTKAQANKKSKAGWRERVKGHLKYYSLSINILVYLRDHFVAMTHKATTPGGEARSRRKSADSYKTFYALPQEDNGMYWYLENPRALKNQASLLDLANFARDSNAKFVVVLVPSKQRATDTKWYEQVRHFLTNNRIRHIDLTSKFGQEKLTSSDLYWRADGHLNPSGNRIVAEILIEEFPAIFRQDINRQQGTEGQLETLRQQ